MGNLNELGFDARNVEPASFDLIPPGEYEAVIVAAEVKPTSSGGKMIKLRLQILNGEFQNRTLFDNLNIWNSSDKARQIAKGTLSAICRAVNVLTPNDTAELCNKPLRVSVGIQKAEKDSEYSDQNKIKSYKPRQSGPAVVPAFTGGTTPAETVKQQPW